MENVVTKISSSTPLIPILIGKGKLALHLHHYFHLIDFNHKHFDDARDLTNPELFRKIKGVNSIWILTTDRSIPEVFQKIKNEMSKYDLNPDHYTFIHSSAASEIEGMQTLHPLMTFTDQLYQLEQYLEIPFAWIGNKIEAFDQIKLPNKIFQIPAKDRSIYHAYAVMMSNLPILLWSLTTHEAKSKLNLENELYDPILKQTLQNFLSKRGSALTGPISRKDSETINKNLSALIESPLGKIYQTFLTATHEGDLNDHSA